MIKIWNSSQVCLLKQINEYLRDNAIPDEVLSTIEESINILGKHYGDKRDPEEDLGGYLCVQLDGLISDSKEYFSLLHQYGTSVEMAEFTEPIIVHKDNLENHKNIYQWFQQVFILSSDYTLTFIYKDII